MSYIALFCQRHECIIRDADYRSHMNACHDGRSDCIGGITTIAQVEAILAGATYTDAMRTRTLRDLAEQAAVDTRGESALRFTVRVRDLYEQEHGERVGPKVIMDALRDIGINVLAAAAARNGRMHVSATWTCESTGIHCRYDNIIDPAHDSCVDCGEPDERL